MAWSMVHGIAKLAITGRLPYHSKSDVLKFAEFMIDQSLPLRTFPNSKGWDIQRSHRRKA